MFSSNECTIFLTVYVQIKWVYNILDSICLIQMSVQYTWQYRFSSNECTIYLTVICLIQMSVQDTWQYTFSTHDCTIYLTI